MLGDTECDTELCLSPAGGGCLYCPSSHSNSAGSSRMTEGDQEGRTSHQQQQQQQQITIFYGGRVCVCDATEFQARAIICMAKRKMEEMAAKKDQNHQGTLESYHHPSPTLLMITPPAILMPPLLSPGLSMKRSLQRFLQKRKSRTRESSSPYNNTHHHFPLP